MKNQFHALQNWTFEILNAIKKDLKSDHLHTDPVFYKTYFGNRPQNRLSTEEIFAAYEKELEKGNEPLAEFVVNRWVFKHGDLYQMFAERLEKINPEFDQIKELSEKESQDILKGIPEAHGAIATFLFCVLNGVVFPQSVLDKLEKAALAEKVAQKKEEEGAQEEANLQKVISAQVREIARLNDKLLGVQKKYTTDTEALKKQIKALQQKLSVHANG
jgi:hypothetical protein